MDERLAAEIEVGVSTQEGFANEFLMRFPNGLIFSTKLKLIWIGSKARQDALIKFREVIAVLRNAGIAIEGECHLEDI